MKNKAINNAKVGAFVLAGVIFLIFTLYMIGKNRNLLGSTFILKAKVGNVNGLVPGNNVRFRGIDVGTVKSIDVENDSNIIVTMVIDEKMKPFLKKNAIASIGTDGLMGNRLVNINIQAGVSEIVEAGDVINSRKPVETDEMLRTLNTTNDNIAMISGNLYEITEKLNHSESLWTLLSDTVMTQDLKGAVKEFRQAGANASGLTRDARAIVQSFGNGNGIAQRLFTDTTLANQLNSSVLQIKTASYQTSQMIKDLQRLVDDMKAGEGTAGLLLSDTLLRQKLFNSASNIEEGTDRFNENMEALRHHYLFKGYFKKMEKEQQQEAKEQKH
jgi:phospholipid/cholesterol/gamma-HCH transport system substrate-binding protein